jgi:hypothetical protein
MYYYVLHLKLMAGTPEQPQLTLVGHQKRIGTLDGATF